MHVIGTAGHVDHGKTSLLRLLTGMEPSRLAEERTRGMTMQLGFVWMPGEDDRPIGVVDVPGHADYRLHTITGASTIDAFLFICACDDGWMPQSEEHLWALSAFGVTHGVVVLTKTDLVDKARFAELAAEMEVRFFEALGREIPIVGFSATTGEGLADLRRNLFRELGTLPQEKDLGRPQMFVDRVFSVAGQGTVVTGTLRDGTLSDRQVVEVLPSRKKTQVRSIQMYGRAVRAALPNARVALQLANLSVTDVPRDSQIVDPMHVFLTAAIDVRLRTYQSYRINPKKNPEVIVVHGGVKTKAKLIAIGPLEEEREPTWHVRLKLEVERMIRFDERCLIVSAGGDRVLGAGRVVDESPGTSITVAADLLPLIADYSVEEYLALNVAKIGALRFRDIEKRTRFPPLEETFGFLALDDWLAEPSRAEEWNAAIMGRLAKQHKEMPTEEGLAESALVKALRLDADLLHSLLRALKKSNAIQQVGPYLKVFGYVPRADHTTKLAIRLEGVATCDEPVAQSYADLGVTSEETRRVLGRFVADGKLVRLDEDHVMGAVAHRILVERIQGFLATHGPGTAAEIRDHLEIGRKVVILVLESMDHAKLTYRDGNHRGLGRTKPRLDPMAPLRAQFEGIANSAEPLAFALITLGVADDEGRKVFDQFVADGRIIDLDGTHVIGIRGLQSLTLRVLQLLAEKGPLTVAELRTELQIGRKVVVKVLEAMDRENLTRRTGERRELVKPEA